MAFSSNLHLINTTQPNSCKRNFYQLRNFKNITESTVSIQQRLASYPDVVTESRALVPDSAVNIRVLTALNNLQRKIKQLEVERAQAEQNIDRLCNDPVLRRDTWDQENNQISNGVANGLSAQLSTEVHCTRAIENKVTENIVTAVLEKKSMDSPFKHSFIGSYYQPPNLEKILVPTAGVEQRPASNQLDLTMGRTSNSIGLMDLGLSNKAVASALKSLQEKIWRMEVERTEAEQNLKRLGHEASQYKNALEHEKEEVVNVKSQVTNEICAQLATVEGRCSLLEKQLDYMRNMVVQAETEKNILLEKQASVQLERYLDNAELQSKLEKLEILEQDCFKVNATQTRAENKIHELELKLQEEEHQRKLIQDKAAEVLQTGLVMNRILMESSSAKMKKKKKKKQGSEKISTGQEYIRPPSAWPKFADFPFVAGKSTSHSHSVTANVQNVFHLMKHHNTKITDRNQRPSERRGVMNIIERTCNSNTLKNASPRSVSSCSSCTPSEGLSELLLALQDELGQMSFEHQDLLKQIQEIKNTNVREDLERELDSLVKRMERKGDQICTLKKHQNNVEKLRQKARKFKRQAASVKKRAKDLDGMNELPVIPWGTEFSAKTTSALGQKGKESLQLLRNAQKLQMTLKKDDIVWDQ